MTSRFPLVVAPLALLCTLLLPGLARGEGEEVVETVTLQPKEKKLVSVDASEKIKLGWQHTDDSVASKCKKMCVMLTKQGSSNGIASMYGASMGIIPVDGKVAATFENVEDFPIEIEVLKKAANR